MVPIHPGMMNVLINKVGAVTAFVSVGILVALILTGTALAFALTHKTGGKENESLELG